MGTPPPPGSTSTPSALARLLPALALQAASPVIAARTAAAADWKENLDLVGFMFVSFRLEKPSASAPQA